LGWLSRTIRSRGLIHKDKVTIATLTFPHQTCAVHWGQEVRTGDFIVFPAGRDVDSVCAGNASYAMISLAPSDLRSMLSGEDYLIDSAFWNAKSVRRVDPTISVQLRQLFEALLPNLERMAAFPQAVDFLRRMVIEDFMAAFINNSSQKSFRYPGARLVRQVDNYVDAAQGRPVHISEICQALDVSRRSLHRAFADTLNMGPITYLRYKRLSTVRRILKHSDPAVVKIGDIAIEHGFFDPGRFAAYYRTLFGESPSQTLAQST
jgi:AraC family ethanolamine operon transcriptional activator